MWYYHLVDPVVICRAIHYKLVQMKTEGTTHIYVLGRVYDFFH